MRYKIICVSKTKVCGCFKTHTVNIFIAANIKMLPCDKHYHMGEGVVSCLYWTETWCK